MKKYLQIILILLSTAIKTSGQTSLNCDSLFNKRYKLSDVLSKKASTFFDDVSKEILCKYDSVDLVIFLGPSGNLPFQVLPVMEITKNRPAENAMITVAELIEPFDSLRKSKEYAGIRNIVTATWVIKEKTADPANWETDKLLLKRIGFDTLQVSKIRSLVFKSPNLSYREVFTRLSQDLSVASSSKPATDTIAPLPSGKQKYINGLYAYIDYTEGIKKAKESNKPVLLYFTAYGSVNARKMDVEVLLNQEIQSIINDYFEPVVLWTDERTPLSPDKIYYSKLLKRNVKFTGDLNSELQIKISGSNMQPMFIIANQDGLATAMIGHVSLPDFKDFLNKRSGK